MRASLSSNRELGRHDPQADLDLGDRLRSRSLRLAVLTSILAGAVLLLTGAQLTRGGRLQAVLLTSAVLVWVLAVGGAAGVGLR